MGLTIRELLNKSMKLSSRNFCDWVQLIGDLQDKRLAEQCFDHKNPCLIHLASVVSAQGETDPGRCWGVNSFKSKFNFEVNIEFVVCMQRARVNVWRYDALPVTKATFCKLASVEKHTNEIFYTSYKYLPQKKQQCIRIIGYPCKLHLIEFLANNIIKEVNVAAATGIQKLCKT